MSSIINSGLQGLKSGFNMLAKEADRSVRSFQSESEIDPIEPLVGMKVAEHQIKASAKVVKVGDELNQTILDILA